MSRIARIAVLTTVALLLVAHLRAEDCFGVTASNRLIRFDTFNPSGIVSNVPITGLQASENVVGIDFRPNTGQLYAVGSTSRLYVLNVVTGVATQVGATQFNPLLSGNHFAVDFNPSVDRIRCCSETGPNLRVNPDTGAINGTDTPLTYAPLDPGAGTSPRVVSVAYNNNVPSASVSGTTLYAIDSTQDALVTIGTVNGGVSSNGGVVYTVGKLGFDTSDIAGFDISGQTGIAYAALTPAGSAVSNMYVIDLSTGTASLVDAIAAGELVYDIAVVSAPQPYDVVAVRGNGQLTRFQLANVNTVPSASTAVTGLTPGDQIFSIAFRPSSGVLYGLGMNTGANTGRVYTLNPVTGAAVQVTPAANPLPLTTAVGQEQAFSFDPAIDQIRIMNEDRQNILVNADTGIKATTDTALTYAATDVNKAKQPDISTITSNGNASRLLGIDRTLNVLVSSTSAASGVFNTVGALGAGGGFESLTLAPNGTYFASINSNLYTVSTTTGAATQVGVVGIGGGNIRGIAAVPALTQTVLQFSAANFNAIETNVAQLTVTRTGNLSGVVSVDYAITSGTATAGTHFNGASGTLTFLNNETQRTIFVTTLNDNHLDLLLTANATLSNPIGAKLGAQSTATLTIADINDTDGDGFPNDIETAAGTDPNSISSTPFGGAPAGVTQALTVTKVSVKLVFVPGLTGKDSVAFAGTIPLTAIPTGATAICEIGDVNGKSGVIQVFKADAKGKFPKGFTIAKPKNGVAKFSFSASKGTFAAQLANAKLTNATASKVPLTLNCNLYFNNVSFAAAANVTYTATKDKSGSVTLAKKK